MHALLDNVMSNFCASTIVEEASSIKEQHLKLFDKYSKKVMHTFYIENSLKETGVLLFLRADVQGRIQDFLEEGTSQAEMTDVQS